MEHIVLLGDSVFDNKAYVGGAPDVIGHLRSMMPTGWKATLCAVDGATTADIPAQVARVPRDATCLFVSVGGNDALMHMGLLYDGTLDGRAMLAAMAQLGVEFRANYHRAVEEVCALGKPACLCTLYNACFGPDLAAPVEAAVAVVNDKIYSVANEKGLPVIDLRRICDRPEDYANPIEPSDIGGKKIAAAVLEHVRKRHSSAPPPAV
ncbi:MAG: SGNH/GDSL hydrolase family protein [Dehalococcoidia bacterium]|nr:SGNH/GDSL hydrolase family protein [Dehalococcoidia bacterium]